MTVAWISAEESIRTGTGDPHTFAATVPSGTRGIVLGIGHGTSSTDHAAATAVVTVGGKAMGKVCTATSTTASGEPGRTDIWFLGHDLPAAGAQTLSVDLASGTTDDMVFYLAYLSGATDLEVAALAAINRTTNSTNPTSGTIAYGGRTCMAVGVLYSGLVDVSVPTPNANMSTVDFWDPGAFGVRIDRQTTPGSADFTFSYTAGTDDWCMCVVAVTEERTSLMRDYVLSLVPVGYWRLNEPVGCLTAFDRSPNLRHGTYTGGVTLGQAGGLTGDADTAILPNGTTGYVLIPDNSAFSLPTTTQLSVLLVCKFPPADGGGHVPISKNASGQSEWFVFDWGDGSSAYPWPQINILNGTSIARADSPAQTQNIWRQFIFTADDTADQLYAYTDAVRVAEDTTWSGTAVDGTSPVRIGTYDGAGNFFAGAIDEAAVFPDVLTVDEIGTIQNIARGKHPPRSTPLPQMLAH